MKLKPSVLKKIRELGKLARDPNVLRYCELLRDPDIITTFREHSAVIIQAGIEVARSEREKWFVQQLDRLEQQLNQLEKKATNVVLLRKRQGK